MQRLSADEADLQARATANIAEAFRRVARLAPLGAIEEAYGLTIIATGIPFPPFNPTFVARPLDDPAGLAARLRQFYDRAGVAGMLFAAGAGEAAYARPLAREASLTPGDPVPLMLLAPLPDPPALPAGLEIRAVGDMATLRVYNDTLAAGFGLPREWLSIFDSSEALQLLDIAFYLGFIDGAPVATSLLFTSHRVAGVFNVATLPAYRRRGLGAALAWHAVRAGREQGCLASALQSSALGFPVYARMGFRHVADYRTWLIQ